MGTARAPLPGSQGSRAALPASRPARRVQRTRRASTCMRAYCSLSPRTSWIHLSGMAMPSRASKPRPPSDTGRPRAGIPDTSSARLRHCAAAACTRVRSLGVWLAVGSRPVRGGRSARGCVHATTSAARRRLLLLQPGLGPAQQLACAPLTPKHPPTHLVRLDELVGEHEVHARVHVGVQAKVLPVAPAEAPVDAVVPVEHGRDAIEAEAIKPGGQVGAPQRAWHQMAAACTHAQCVHAGARTHVRACRPMQACRRGGPVPCV